MGIAGAKVLRELGNKVKKLEKLDAVDILYEVHEAAEELQKKIDRKSYLLVNSESWEIRKPKRPQNFHDITTEANDLNDCYSKSLSETIIDVKSLQSSKSWDGRNLNIDAGRIISSGAGAAAEPENDDDDDDEEDDESKTYASASALSLATFASLLIEFVARLQNLVDAFEELSKKANFNEPPPPPPVNLPETVEQVGFWTRLLRPFKS